MTDWSNTTDPEDAVRVLTRCYRERAREEALFRALLAERNLKPRDARFWIDVYGALVMEHGDSELQNP